MRSPNSYLRKSWHLALVLAAALASVSVAQDANDTDWQALAAGVGLSDADIQQLGTDRILISNQSYKQVFTPYLSSPLPFFVTSDSLLNAYHVLYEESILRLEQAQSRTLPETLRFVLANLDPACAEVRGQAELVAAARQRASIVMGTALKLLDDEFVAADETLIAIIDDEVARIVAARVMMKPEWLGPPEPDFLALDYTRYKVRGFYTRSETLTRHFRAVAWLQSIPFRLSHDDELLAILLLGRCLAREHFGDDVERYEAYRRFFRTYTEFLGVGDDWDLVTAADAVAAEADLDLEAKRAELLAQAEQEDGTQINDQLRFAPDDPNATAEPNFRIISAYRLPDAALFQRTADIRTFPDRLLPNGLEVCIALGSAFARARIEDVEKTKLLATIDASLGLFSGTSLYFDYLSTIATLLDAPEPNAPAFMAAEPWQAKSCGAALAGWAQLRHTWVLQAKLNAHYRSRTTPPPGFVEPEPEFFRRLADLAARTNDLLASAGALGTSYFDLVEALTEITDLLEQADDLDGFDLAFRMLPEDDWVRLLYLEGLVYDLEGDKEARVEQLRQMADDLSEGILDPLLEGLVWQYTVDLEPRWPLLEETSRRLEAIARKQLDGDALTEEDENFLHSYGATIAQVMFYDGNSYSTPRDDAPRIVDIYSNPWAGGNLHVGISRARTLYVLYPWDGDFVLCRGAVMPYYEFVDGARLTDAEWQDRLDSDARPDVPNWLRPIISEQGLSAPFSESANGTGR